MSICLYVMLSIFFIYLSGTSRGKSLSVDFEAFILLCISVEAHPSSRIHRGQDRTTVGQGKPNRND